MSDEIEQLANLFVVVICAFLILLIIGIVLWARSHIGEVQTRGSAIAIADKLMHASCIGANDTLGRNIPFFFEKSALDKYNNTNLPAACIDLSGSMYFVEVRTAADMWVFNSANQYPYAYHARIRGLTRECMNSEIYSNLYPSASSLKVVFSSPFRLGSAFDAGILRYSATVRSGETISAAYVSVIVDPDSGTEYYPEGFPLCLTDVVCPPSAQGKCKCVKEKKCVNIGNDCASGSVISCT